MAGLSGGVRVVRAVLGNASVRRVQVAWWAFCVAEYGVWVAVLVYAYERSGPSVAGLVAVAQLLPAAAFAPLAAGLADRGGGGRALRRGYWAEAVTLGATAALLLSAVPAALVYLAAILASCAVTTTRPAQAKLLASLVGRGEELTAANVLSGWSEAVSLLVGPGLCGALVELGGPGLAVAAFAACVAASAWLVGGVGDGRNIGDGRDIGDASGQSRDPATAPARTTLTLLRADREVRALIALLGAQYLVLGVLDVMEVVLAARVVGLGASGAGFLSAAFGAGSVIGSLASLLLVRRARLSAPVVIAAGALAVVLVGLGAWPTALTAFLLIAGAGSARTVLDVGGRTLLVRTTPPAVRARVFGVLEGVSMVGLAAGSALVPAVIAVSGATLSLIAVGLLLGVIAAAAAAGLRRADAAQRPREPVVAERTLAAPARAA